MAMAAEVKLPPLMPLPPSDVRQSISLQEWQDFITSWTFLSKAYLSLPPELFAVQLSRDRDGSMVEFLGSYMSCMARSEVDANYLEVAAAADLRRNVFLLVHRLTFETDQAPPLVTGWSFLGDLSRVYRRSNAIAPLLEKIWSRHESNIAQSMNDGYRKDAVSKIESGGAAAVVDEDQFALRLLPLLRACPSAGTFLITGSDVLDAVVSAYPAASLHVRSKLLLLIYLCLSAPLRLEKQNQSLLFDHIYSLMTTAKSSRNQLLADLVSTTPFLPKLRKSVAKRQDPRAKTLVKDLEEFQSPGAAKLRRRKIDKGKGKETSAGAQTTANGIHVHRMSLVTQLQDLFPDLGSGFIIILLDEYGDDVEAVTAHLLENDLPPHLQSADRTEVISQQGHATSAHDPALEIDLEPRKTPPLPAASALHEGPTPSAITNQPSATQTTLPIRRNIHDNDTFDKLHVPASQIRFGRREQESENAVASLAPSDAASRAASKAAILSALSAFDADDDERDDTYDLADVGGTVDTAATGQDGDVAERRSGAGGPAGTADDATLFAAFKATPEVFGRDAATRRGAPRRALKEETGMTDEAIEGWRVMMARDPRRLQRLEERFALGSAGAGAGAGRQQRELERTSWRGGAGDGGSGATSDEDGRGATSSGGEIARGGRGGVGGRGRGRGRGRGGQASSNVAGPPGDAQTQKSRQRKEANKGGRANHNRRDQRAKKMARGGLPG